MNGWTNKEREWEKACFDGRRKEKNAQTGTDYRWKEGRPSEGGKEQVKRRVGATDVSKRKFAHFKSKNHSGNKVSYFTQSVFIAQSISKYQKVPLEPLSDIICNEMWSWLWYQSWFFTNSGLYLCELRKNFRWLKNVMNHISLLIQLIHTEYLMQITVWRSSQTRLSTGNPSHAI